MTKYIHYFLLIFTLGLSAQQVSIQADTTQLRIGEQVIYKINVNAIENVVFPVFVPDNLHKIELIEALAVDTLKNRLEKKYILTSFDSGSYVIPSQEIRINNTPFFTDSLRIYVSTVPLDTINQPMFAIKAIRGEEFSAQDYLLDFFDSWLNLLLFIAVLVLLIIVVFVLIYKLRGKKLMRIKVEIPAIQVAMQRLKELDAKDLLKQHKIKRYYSELTDIVRTYLEKDVHIPALELTTDELVETITDFNESSDLGISKETIQQLKGVLQTADLVKFAKSAPEMGFIHADRKVIETVLVDTKKAVEKTEVVSENQQLIAAQEVAEKRSNFALISLIIVGGLLVVGLFIGGYAGYQYLQNDGHVKTTTELNTKQWHTSTYGYPTVTISTPEMLRATTIQVPEQMEHIIRDMTVYVHGDLKANFYVAVQSTSFIKPVNDFNLDNSVAMAFAQLRGATGYEFYEVSQEAIQNNGVAGRKAIGYYKINSMEHKVTLVIYRTPKGLRQVIISQLKGDENANAITQRIVTSIKINP
ncbi:MAG: hypothetical protein JKY08_03620 [Flavobacteriaceae bacterium]|nr:hypothetical protein [Flavobacteriaceae bacterium]